MEKKDADLLVAQIRNILLNKPKDESLVCKSEELIELQSAIDYLADTFLEANTFVKAIAQGNFDVETPSRNNFVASNLKELHANLKHLTWQANQVANGDYNQRVRFLGDFSTSFNKMIEQLSEREAELKEQALIVETSAKLFMSVIDCIKDCIIVTSKSDGEVLYVNNSAKNFIYSDKENVTLTFNKKEIMAFIKGYHKTEHESEIHEFEFQDPFVGISIKTYAIKWNDNLANVHYISDVTEEKMMLDSMEQKAYKDELTGIYNRHYIKEKMQYLIENNKEFTFCMIDLDGLKFANDNFGHKAGDEYLRIVARALSSEFDCDDIVSRLGGDEFAVLSISKDMDEVEKLVKVVDIYLTNVSNKYPMSVSYGAINLPKGNKLTEEDIVNFADKKMYAFKKARKKERIN